MIVAAVGTDFGDNIEPSPLVGFWMWPLPNVSDQMIDPHSRVQMRHC